MDDTADYGINLEDGTALGHISFVRLIALAQTDVVVANPSMR